MLFRSYMSLTDPESGGVKSMSNWSPHTLIVSSGQYSSTKSLSLLRGYTYDIDVWEWNDVSVGQLELLWNQPSTGTTIPPYSSAATGGYRQPPSVGTRPLTSQRPLSFTPSADFISCVGDGNCSGSAPITVTVNGGDGVGEVSFAYESGPCTVATVSPATDPPTGKIGRAHV